MKIYDYIVVGSGCSGAMVAQTLVEKGAEVTMLDVGAQKKESAYRVPAEDFISIRRNDPNQQKYLIGEKASGVMWGKLGKGEQITPPREHIMRHVEDFIPVESDSFSPLESLGYGGLGIGWGLQCWEYSRADMEATGLDPERMSRAYKTIGSRIGISATKDDASKYTIGTLNTYHKSPKMDRNHRYIHKRYLDTKAKLNKRGFYMGRTPLALITEDVGNRKKYQYRDMDFYSDHGLSAWRPWITVDQLKQRRNFKYLGGFMVTKFAEKGDYTEVSCLGVEDKKITVFACRKLILSTSALGTARLVLRSLGKPSQRLPLLCNPYSYVPCVQPRFIGKAVEPQKLGFTQLSLFLDKDHRNSGASVASLYSYQSLMLFRIIRHVPINFADARVIMRYLMSGIVIMGIHHPDSPSPSKYLTLGENTLTPTGDALKVSYSLSRGEEKAHQQREKDFIKAMRRMGAYGIRKINPGYGSSIHYAGTLPFSRTEKEFTLSPAGKLHGTRGVYVADSSGFKYLPAPGLTFSLMANAHLVAESALSE